MTWLRATLLLTPALSLCLTSGCNGNDGEAGAPGDGDSGPSLNEPPPRRVVGYLPTYRSLALDRLDFDTLTHLCIAFANPTGEGSESDFEVAARSQIPPIVEAAHAKGVLVLASIAGGTKASGELVGAQIVPEKVDDYIAGLLDLIERYDLDGIDVDIEGGAVTETYEPFVHALASALPEGMVLTAAVATKNGEAFSDRSLEPYDFINVMAYDHCSWTETPCDQASLEGAISDLEYWTETRAYPKDKTVLGVPFYGWCWGCTEMQTALTWPQILRDYPQGLTTDWIEEGDVTISLNSPPTIREKALLAQEYGGVMIWELGQDAAGDQALFRVIAEVQ